MCDDPRDERLVVYVADDGIRPLVARHVGREKEQIAADEGTEREPFALGKERADVEVALPEGVERLVVGFLRVLTQLNIEARRRVEPCGRLRRESSPIFDVHASKVRSFPSLSQRGSFRHRPRSAAYALCYRGRTMSKRAGVTEKVSISLNRDDLAALKKRAKRLHGGNVSAVIAELAADARQLEAMNELVDWLGGPDLTDEDRVRLDREMRGESPSPTKKSPSPARKKSKSRKAS